MCYNALVIDFCAYRLAGKHTLVKVVSVSRVAAPIMAAAGYWHFFYRYFYFLKGGS
nr:MAG TPA: hypothetical protein [Caudoviricetes sp.]